MSERAPDRAVWPLVVAPAAWVLAVVGSLGVQLVVCANGTDAESTLVRSVIVALAVVSLVLTGVPAWRSRRRDDDDPAEPAAWVFGTLALGSVILGLVALLVPTNAVC